MLHEIKMWVVGSPDAIAVEWLGGRRTYRELNDDVRMAEQILEERSCLSRIVAVRGERGYGAIVALLACLGIGRTYVPLDPTWPKARSLAVLEASGADLLLTVEDVALTHFETLAPASQSSREDLGYIIFTSGSTGLPKGVMVSRTSLLQRIDSLIGMIDTGSRMLLNTSIAFDISLLEMLLPLVAGGTVLCIPGAQKDLAAFVESIVALHPTHIQGTPTFFAFMERMGWPLPKDMHVWCGGEALTPMLASDLLKCSRTLWNFYGPTEATIWCTYQQITDPDHVTVGRSFGGTRLAIDVENGELGEVILSGSGIAEGYLDVIASGGPFFMHQDNGWSYRTGDRGYIDEASGELHLVGRCDQQVKINGYRIELGDIETNLARHPEVSDCAVVATMDSDDVTRLTAFVVVRQKIDQRELRVHCREFLPRYSVPQRIRFVESLPVNTAGKVDRPLLVVLAGQGE